MSRSGDSDARVPGNERESISLDDEPLEAGSVEQPPATAAAPASARPQVGGEPSPSAASAPPAPGGIDLDEIDEAALVMLDGSAAPSGSAPSLSLPSGSAPSLTPPSGPAPSLTPPSGAPGAEQVQPPPAGQPPPARASSPAGPQGELLQLEQPAPVHRSSAPPAAAPSAPASRMPAATSARRARRPAGPRAWLRAHARARLAIGFSVAVVAGGILPLAHARSVVSSRVAPLQKQLVAATHKPGGGDAALASELGERISATRLRFALLTFLLWTASAAVLVALWVRFT